MSDRNLHPVMQGVFAPHMAEVTPVATRFTLPDDARVAVYPQIGERQLMTLGEVCNRWKDSRHFSIEGTLCSTGEYRSLGLTVRLLEVKHGKWTISFDPLPIPARNVDWQFTHEDFDASWEGEEDGYVSNGLCGYGPSVADCLNQIADIEEERGMPLTGAA